MVCLVNSVTLSDKAEDEGVAGSYVEDENAARGVVAISRKLG